MDHITTIVVVTGALDECAQDDMQVLFQLLPEAQKLKSLRLEIFLTSRPKLPARLAFKEHDSYQKLDGGYIYALWPIHSVSRCECATHESRSHFDYSLSTSYPIYVICLNLPISMNLA